MTVVPVEVYSRVSGYYRPVNQWNKAKREEFKNRISLDMGKALKQKPEEHCCEQNCPQKD